MKWFEDRFKRFFIKVLKFFIGQKELKVFSFQNVKRILIIRQHNQLGDMLCAVPLFRALRDFFPDSKIDLISRPINTPVVINNPYLNSIIEYDSIKYAHSPLSLIKFIRSIRRTKYDMVITPATVSTSVTSDLIAYLSKAKLKIGVAQINDIKNQSGFVYNLPVKLDWRDQPNKHQTERNLDILKPFEITTNDLSIAIGITKELKEQSQLFLKESAEKDKILIGMHPGAGKCSNKWPTEKFVELIHKLLSNAKYQIYVTSGPVDAQSVNHLKSVFNDKIVIIEESSILKVAAIIDGLDLFISNDTGVMHVASATGTPVLSLFGITNPYEWAPRREMDRFLLAKDGNLDNLLPDEVYRNILEMLSSFIKK